MYRIILIDDEPLILAGIASLITWEDHNCTIIGKATNGTSAFSMITEQKPDIVITDIRMPVISGLELIEKCKEAGYNFAFIVLTNLEEFPLAKKALALGASDYLIKIELNEHALSLALERAKETCDLLKSLHLTSQEDSELKTASPQAIWTNYVHQLFFTNTPPVTSTIEMIDKDIKPFVLLFSLRPVSIDFHADVSLDLRQISSQISDVLGSILSRYLKLYTLLLCEGYTFMIAGTLKEGLSYEDSLTGCLEKISSALKTYFELNAVFGVSSQKTSVSQLTEAWNEAGTALDYYYYDSVTPIVFFSGQESHKNQIRNFNINFLKKDISAAITRNDSETVKAIFNQIIELFAVNKPGKEHAISACINIYTYLYSFFETDDDTYHDIFPYTINIAEQLNQFNSLNDILEWLQSFCTKLCRLLTDRKETKSDRIVEQAKSYVNEHYKEKLALSDISDAMNISAGHLSNSFKKFSGITLSDYIAYVKVEHAKDLIDTHQYLIYQISDMLGFDNPYYFSKVFKKITGISPKEHENRRKNV